MKLLELFKGTGSVGKVASKMGYSIKSLDCEAKYKPDILTDILKWDYKKWSNDNKFIPDFIWASPPCNTYSPLAYPLKERNIETAEPKSERAKLGTKILYKTLEIINYFKSKNPKLKFTIENPHGMMRKDKKMKKLHIETTLYGMYGDTKRKLTDFWANFNMNLKKPEDDDKNKKYTSVINLKLDQRYSIPSKLVKHILEQSKL